MSVTILSKRLFKIDQKESLIPLFKELRDLAKKQNGFISRGTFSSLTDPGEYIVISEWETAGDSASSNRFCLIRSTTLLDS